MRDIANIATDNLEEIVEIGSNFKIVVTGHSMLPLLGFGRDTIVLRRIDDTEDISNRVAMFRNERGHIVVHRVISIQDGVVTLRGDGNLYQIEKTPRKRIIALLESVIRESGKEVSCTSPQWQRKERLWLSLPLWARRYTLAILRRWCNFRDNKR